jgi:hypothetical protein
MDGPYFLPSGGNKENLKDLISQLIILSSFLFNLEIRNRALHLGKMYGERTIENTFKHARVESNKESLKSGVNGQSLGDIKKPFPSTGGALWIKRKSRRRRLSSRGDE